MQKSGIDSSDNVQRIPPDFLEEIISGKEILDEKVSLKAFGKESVINIIRGDNNNRANFECPACKRPVRKLMFPYLKDYPYIDLNQGWQCNECIVKKDIALVYDKEKLEMIAAQPDVLRAMDEGTVRAYTSTILTKAKRKDVYSSSEINSTSYKKVTTKVKKLFDNLGLKEKLYETLLSQLDDKKNLAGSFNRAYNLNKGIIGLDDKAERDMRNHTPYRIVKMLDKLKDDAFTKPKIKKFGINNRDDTIRYLENLWMLRGYIIAEKLHYNKHIAGVALKASNTEMEELLNLFAEKHKSEIPLKDADKAAVIKEYYELKAIAVADY